MANIKSAKKRIKVIAKKTLRNKMIRSRTRTSIKNLMLAIEKGNKSEVETLLVDAVCQIDRAASKGIIHKNNASRKKSRLTKLVNKMSA